MFPPAHLDFRPKAAPKMESGLSGLQCTELYCTALHCTVFHYTILNCTTLHSSVLHKVTLHCVDLPWTVFYCATLHCIALHCTVLHWHALHICTALHCSTLFCIVLLCSTISKATVQSFPLVCCMVTCQTFKRTQLLQNHVSKQSCIRLTNERAQTDHVIWGPMRGLEKVDMKRGHINIYIYGHRNY